jgi:hypothetical protein
MVLTSAKSTILDILYFRHNIKGLRGHFRTSANFRRHFRKNDLRHEINDLARHFRTSAELPPNFRKRTICLKPCFWLAHALKWYTTVSRQSAPATPQEGAEREGITTMLTTTLNEIRSHGPCKDGWEKLLKHLGKTAGDDEALPLATILTSNDLDDALWVFRRTHPSARNAYDEAIASAWNAFNEACATAQKVYEDAIAPARKARDEAIASAWKVYEEACAPARKVYDEARAAIFLRIVSET